MCAQVSELGGGQKLAGLCDFVVKAFDEAGLLLPVSAGQGGEALGAGFAVKQGCSLFGAQGCSCN
jgi:hypothetical protein